MSDSLRLSRRQAEILELLRQGLTPAEVAARLFISEKTVTWHQSQILYKSGTRSTREALALYYESRLRAEYAPRVRGATA